MYFYRVSEKQALKAAEKFPEVKEVILAELAKRQNGSPASAVAAYVAQRMQEKEAERKQAAKEKNKSNTCTIA